MEILDHQDKNVIRTTKLIYFEYLIFGIYFILFILFVVLMCFSEMDEEDLGVIVFWVILIPSMVVFRWRLKLIRYQDGKIREKELLSNFWSSRLALVALVLFCGTILIQGTYANFLNLINYNDLTTKSIAKALILVFTGLFIFLHLVYAIVTGLLIKKINESQKTE